MSYARPWTNHSAWEKESLDGLSLPDAGLVKPFVWELKNWFPRGSRGLITKRCCNGFWIARKIVYITKIIFIKDIYKLKWDAQKECCAILLSEDETHEHIYLGWLLRLGTCDLGKRNLSMLGHRVWKFGLWEGIKRSQGGVLIQVERGSIDIFLNNNAKGLCIQNEGKATWRGREVHLPHPASRVTKFHLSSTYPLSTPLMSDCTVRDFWLQTTEASSGQPK